MACGTCGHTFQCQALKLRHYPPLGGWAQGTSARKCAQVRKDSADLRRWSCAQSSICVYEGEPTFHSLSKSRSGATVMAPQEIEIQKVLRTPERLLVLGAGRPRLFEGDPGDR